MKQEEGKNGLPVEKLSPEKEPPRNTKVTGAKIPLNEQDSERVEKERTQGTEGIF
jgi:hypothetical protein